MRGRPPQAGLTLRAMQFACTRSQGGLAICLVREVCILDNLGSRVSSEFGVCMEDCSRGYERVNP